MTEARSDVTLDGLQRRIPESELVFTFTRSGGPGGQNVNKVNTRATLWFDVAASPALTGEEKRAIERRLVGRIGRDRRLHVSSSRHRTQSANRDAAIERFFELLAGALARAAPRKRPKPPRGARERRLRSKRERSLRKQRRRPAAMED